MEEEEETFRWKIDDVSEFFCSLLSRQHQDAKQLQHCSWFSPVCVCVCACICVCMCMCVCLCAWVCVHMCACVRDMFEAPESLSVSVWFMNAGSVSVMMSWRGAEGHYNCE